MPKDTRLQDTLRRIASERSISLSEARRVLIEQIDYHRRIQVRKTSTIDVQVSPEGRTFRASMKQVPISNPHRIMTAGDFNETDVPAPKRPLSEKQLQALRNGNKIRHKNSPNSGTPRPVKSPPPSTHFSSSLPPLRNSRAGYISHKNPRPGTMTSIIHSELNLNLPEYRVLDDVMKSLRTHHFELFAHLAEDALRHRIQKVAWDYGLQYRSYRLKTP